MFIKRRAIRKLRIELEKGNILTTALNNAGIKARSTLGDWAKKNKRLRPFIQACEERGMQKRVAIVNDAFFKKLAEGKASGSEYEFFLCNREPSMWKKQTEYLGGQNQGDAPRLPQKPIVNYIFVQGQANVEVNGNGHGGNGNGKRIEEHA